MGFKLEKMGRSGWECSKKGWGRVGLDGSGLKYVGVVGSEWKWGEYKMVMAILEGTFRRLSKSKTMPSLTEQFKWNSVDLTKH